MAPFKHELKGKANKTSRSGIRKPAQTKTGKSQLLISRFFGAKVSPSANRVIPTTASIASGRAKCVKPLDLVPLPSKPISPKEDYFSAQPEQDTLATTSTAPTDHSNAKLLSPSENVPQEDEPVDVKLPRKRVRLSAGFHRDVDKESEKFAPYRRKTKVGTCHDDEDPDFVLSSQTNGDDDDVTSLIEMELDRDNTNEDITDHDSAERNPHSQRRSLTLTSYGSYRTSRTDQEKLPRDAERQQLFKQKIWPLGKRTLSLQSVVNGDEARDLKEAGCVARSTTKNYTPLESQFVTLRQQHPHMLLVIECGYKYRMFDSDASVASKVLRVAAYFDRNFLTASFPTHRLSYHVNRLVQAGYKVGVVSQSETTALKKASSKASTLFERKLSSVYTRGTMVADERLTQPGQASGGGSVVRAATYLMALLEMNQGDGNDSSVLTRQIAFAAVDSVTGRVICDCFMDDVLRSELLSRLTALEPTEILMSIKKSSQPTEAVVKAFARRMGTRMERIKTSSFTKDETLGMLNHAVEAQYRGCEDWVQAIQGCLGALLEYLSQFGLERFMTNATEFTPSRSIRQMSLGADVLRNFEVLGNSNNDEIEGSLLGLLTCTKTAAGSRQMRQWLCHPLVDPGDIIDRLEAVDYLRSNVDSYTDFPGRELLSSAISELVASLSGLPDLEQGFLKITCGRCTPSEFLGVIRALEEVGEIINRIKALAQSAMLPVLLHRMFSTSPRVDEILKGNLVLCLNRSSAANDIHHELFLKGGVSATLFPNSDSSTTFLELVQHLESANVDLEIHERSMEELLRTLRKDHSFSRWEWKKVAKEEFLIEVPVSQSSSIPCSWRIISQTKSVKRFRPPQATRGYDKVLCARETREAVSLKCWKAYLKLFTSVAAPLRTIVKSLANLDCLSALASVAKLPGYSKPDIEVSACAGIHAEGVRHPLAETLQSCHGYVPNDIHLGRNRDKIALIVSGPNYGGKSSYARMTALLVILAQVGSFVPARRAVLSPFDSIHARMGSKDSIGTGMSSLMVELTETSRIMSMATSKSLVVVDELGRGTSTHDGTAIAYATLAYLVKKIQCVTLFITHYPMLASLQNLFPQLLGAYYMDYREESEHIEAVHSGHIGSVFTPPSRRVKITFLYKLTEGVASCSYGLNVAQLASVPEAVIEHAKEKAFELEKKIEECKRDSVLAELMTSFRNDSKWSSSEAADVLRIADTASEA